MSIPPKDRRFGIVSNEPSDDMFQEINLNKENIDKIEVDPSGVTIVRSLFKYRVEIQLLEKMLKEYNDRL